MNNSFVLQPKHFWGILGIILVIGSFTLDNADQNKWVYKLLTPKYVRLSELRSQMYKTDFVINEHVEGFEEFSQLVRSKIRANKPYQILEIRTVNWGTGIFTNNETNKDSWKDFLKINVKVLNDKTEKIVPVELMDLESFLNQRYRDDVLNKWKASVFWVGILISVVCIFL